MPELLVTITNQSVAACVTASLRTALISQFGPSDVVVNHPYTDGGKRSVPSGGCSLDKFAKILNRQINYSSVLTIQKLIDDHLIQQSCV